MQFLRQDINSKKMNNESQQVISPGSFQKQQKPVISQSMKTPQFPFLKWEINFHLIFIALIVLMGVINYQVYIANNYEEIRPLLERSYLSELIQNSLSVQNSSINESSNDTDSKLQLFQVFNGIKFNIYRYSKDPQWQAYRKNLWILIMMAIIWKFITYLVYLCDKFILKRKPLKATNQNFSYINNYIFVFSLLILLFSFRADIVFYMSIIITWYFYVELILTVRKNMEDKLKTFTRKTYDNCAIISFWIIMLVTLYLNQKYEHFRFISQRFQTFIPEFLEPFRNSYRAIHCSQILNMTFLRLLSYGIDRIHQGNMQWEDKQIQLKRKKLVQCEQCQVISSFDSNQDSRLFYCYKGRDHVIKTHHSLSQYLNYTLFTPLMLTGPPISYNNYFSYQFYTGPILTWRNYAYHLFLIFSFQLYQHLFPVITPTQNMTLIQMEVFSLMHLFFIWFKFLIIWRTAKIWSQMYGVHVIDNMSRCVLNNYGFEGFWRMWHRGFNHWLIRYLYVPLGGKQNIMSVIAVVAFVAFWHDHTINIIFWALIIALFMVPQILIKRYFRTKQKHLFTKHWFKYLSAFASAIYIYFLIICNLIGFGYGVGKVSLVLNKLSNNWFDLIWSILIIMSAIMLMFYKRNLQNNVRNY